MNWASYLLQRNASALMTHPLIYSAGPVAVSSSQPSSRKTNTSDLSKIMKLNRILSIPIFAVILMVGFVYYVTVFIFIEGYSGLNSSAGSREAITFTLLAFLSVFSFFVCVLTDPGGVPSGFVPDVEQSLVSSDQRVNQKRCDKCSAYKPPRAHHCRVCRRCVLRMDHHCVWINNCVGHRNYKAFVVVLLYATIATAYSSILILKCSLQKDWDFSGKLPLQIFYVTCGFMILGLTLTLGTLFGWHIYLISRNMTTIEYYDGKRAAWLAKKSGLSYRHPYDVGAFKNFTLLLGPNMLKWLWPTAVSHIKDGLSFPTARDNS